MVKKKIQEKEGKVLTTKDGQELIKYTFEEGDVFIPENNSIISKSHKAVVNDIPKTIVVNKLVCKVKGYNLDENNEEQEIFVNLTPSQANSLQKKISDGMFINQHLFNCYLYPDKDGNEWIGVGIKSEKKPAKSFEDFEKVEEESEEEE